MSRRSNAAAKAHTRRVVATMRYLRDMGITATPALAEAWIALEEGMAHETKKEIHELPHPSQD